MNDSAVTRLVVFTRYPAAGQAKTRMIPALGAKGAAALHRSLAEHTLARVLPLLSSNAVELQIRFAGGSAALLRQWLLPHLHRGGLECAAEPSQGTAHTRELHSPLPVVRFRNQGEGDLGQRMHTAMAEASTDGMLATVIIGTDAPGLHDGLVATAFAELRRVDLVLGPATDGGYYLIGLQCPQPGLFADIPWGTDRVLAETLRCAERAGLRYHLLEELPDIDRPADLALLAPFPTLATFVRS